MSGGGSRRRQLALGVAGLAGLAGATGVAVAARVAKDPIARAEVDRARRFARRVEAREPLPPIPPPLPPGRVVDLPGRGETFVRDTGGTGTPVLLLHGWSASGDLNFFSVFEPLRAAGHRVVAVDHRGHGRGMRSEEPFSLEVCADDAAALVDVLGLGPVVAVGYSMGGPIAMYLADRHPTAVRGLVLAATALEWRADPRDRLAWRTLTIAEVLMRTGTTDGIVERALRDMVERRPDVAPLVPWIGAELRRGDPRVFIAAGRALSRHDARSWAPRLRSVPSAVVVTTQDRLVRPDKQRALAAALGADIVELAADHDAPALDADGLAEAFVDAVRRVTAVAAAAPAGTRA